MAKESVEEIFEQFEQSNPRQQTDKIFSIEGRVSDDNVGSSHVQLSFVQPDLTTRSVQISSSRMCDCGRVVGQKNSLVGSCQHRGCNHFTCTECTRTCSRCKKTYCPDHMGNETTCRHCWPIDLMTRGLKWFFDIEGESERKK